MTRPTWVPCVGEQAYVTWATEMYGPDYASTWINTATANSSTADAFFANFDSFTSDASDQGHLISPTEASALLGQQFDSYVSQARDTTRSQAPGCGVQKNHVHVFWTNVFQRRKKIAYSILRNSCACLSSVIIVLSSWHAGLSGHLTQAVRQTFVNRWNWGWSPVPGQTGIDFAVTDAALTSIQAGLSLAESIGYPSIDLVRKFFACLERRAIVRSEILLCQQANGMR
jgi:hypothetical protein